MAARSAPRLALVPSEPIRERMAGIGIRYLELARRLPDAGVETVLVTAGDPADVPDLPAGAEARAFARGSLDTVLGDVDSVLAQGQLANDVLIEMPSLPTAIDLYDPWLVENLHYASSLGLGPYRNDHATWVLQLTRGDFFLCSSDEQRLYYLGLLTALGRIHPYAVAEDPDLDRLLAAVPFGIPRSLPPHRPVLEARGPGTPLEGEKRILFGGLYDWYDPWPVLEAVAEGPESWVLLLVANPNPESTPQARFDEVERWCRKRGVWQTRVRTLDWLPAARRYDLLRDVDVMAATHRPSLETRLSLRTRFLDGLAAECPVLTTEGGAMSRLLVEHEAGWVVPPGDAEAVRAALESALDPSSPAARSRAAGARRLRVRFLWRTVLAPLVAFAKSPYRDPHKEDFAFAPETRAPREASATARRVGRWLSRLGGRSGGRGGGGRGGGGRGGGGRDGGAGQ